MCDFTKISTLNIGEISIKKLNQINKNRIEIELSPKIDSILHYI